MILKAQNYSRSMEELISSLTSTPTLLLHSCCAPCSTSVITKLAEHFLITVFYYNPNIDDKEEYTLRSSEQARLIAEMKTPNPVFLFRRGIRTNRFPYTRKPTCTRARGWCSLYFLLFPQT